MIALASCPVCGSAPALKWIAGEYQYECASERCPHGVYEFVEQFAPEEEYPLDICWNREAAARQWNQCAGFFESIKSSAAPRAESFAA